MVLDAKIPYSQNIEYPFIANYQVCEERDHLQVLHHQAASCVQRTSQHPTSRVASTSTTVFKAIIEIAPININNNFFLFHSIFI